MVQIKLYDLFRNELKLTDDKAAAFVSAVGDIVESGVNENSSTHATKEDIHKLELKIEQSKNDIYKVVFLTGLLQFLGILGGVIAIVKFMMK